MKETLRNIMIYGLFGLSILPVLIIVMVGITSFVMWDITLRAGVKWGLLLRASILIGAVGIIYGWCKQ